MKIYGTHMENGYGTFVMKFIWPFSWEMIWKSWDYMDIPINPHPYKCLLNSNPIQWYGVIWDWIGLNWNLMGSYMNYMVFYGHFPGFSMDLVGIYVGIYFGIYVGLLPDLVGNDMDDLELCEVIIWDWIGNCVGIYLRIYMGFYWNMALHWEKNDDTPGILFYGWDIQWDIEPTIRDLDVSEMGVPYCVYCFPLCSNIWRPCFEKCWLNRNLLGGFNLPLCKIMEFARWDDESPNIYIYICIYIYIYVYIYIYMYIYIEK